MSKRKLLQTLMASLLIMLSVGWYGMDDVAHDSDPKQETAERPLLLAHYMPWYQTPDTSGYWGWHWTMDHFNPRQTDENGRQQIASHYMPLTGPYDSSDEAVLEYQVALMKLSGIDGVIVDWYGIDDFRDYAVINESTNKLFSYIKAAGLTFVICYEDQTVKHMVDNGYIAQDQAISRGQATMQYLEATWFNDEAYLKVDGKPLLFTFGPQYFRSAGDWQALFSVLDTPASLITLDKHMISDSLSSFPWPPMIGIDINQAVVEAYLNEFYRKARRWDYVVAGAFPGFHDIYAQAGVRDTYGYLPAEDGELFRYTLQTALDQNPDVVQIVTWNDYGEGTIIEPTEEFGYQYLEIVQTARQSIDASFVYSEDVLSLPLQLYQLRQAHSGDDELNAELDSAFNALVAGDIEAASTIINTLQN